MTARARERLAMTNFARLLFHRQMLHAAMRVDKIGDVARRSQFHRLGMALITAIGNVDLRVARNALRHRWEIFLRCDHGGIHSAMTVGARSDFQMQLMIEVRDRCRARLRNFRVAMAAQTHFATRKIVVLGLRAGGRGDVARRATEAHAQVQSVRKLSRRSSRGEED